MSRLKKIANSNTRKLPNIFVNENEKLKLKDNVVDFIEKNFTLTRRNLGFDDTSQVFVAHYVMDRASIEEYLGAPIDDATCKIMLDFLPEKTKQYLNDDIIKDFQKESIECKVYKTNYEYGDGVFHTHCILIEV